MIVRTLHVGVGGRGAWPIRIMGGDPRYRPVAMVDRSPDVCRAAAAKLGLAASACFNDIDAALDAADVDAVILCTPTATHAPLARRAFARGKHVLVEKGMTTNFAEAVALVRDADAAGVKLCVAQNYRYRDNELTIAKLLADSSHPHHPGAVRIVDYIHHRYRPDPLTLNYPYAMVWDMGCHHVDSLACWLGPARRVTARSYNVPWSRYAHDANIAAVIEYESGAVCHYVLTHTATFGHWSAVLQGERGALRTYDVPGVQTYPLPQRQLGEAEPAACQLVAAPESEQGIADAFYRYLAEGIEPGISGQENLKTLAVCEMLVRSAREQRTVEAGELAAV